MGVRQERCRGARGTVWGYTVCTTRTHSLRFALPSCPTTVPVDCATASSHRTTIPPARYHRTPRTVPPYPSYRTPHRTQKTQPILQNWLCFFCEIGCVFCKIGCVFWVRYEGYGGTVWGVRWYTVRGVQWYTVYDGYGVVWHEGHNGTTAYALYHSYPGTLPLAPRRPTPGTAHIAPWHRTHHTPELYTASIT